MRAMLVVFTVGASLAFIGCERSPRPSSGGPSAGDAPTPKSEPKHSPGDGHDHDHEPGEKHDHDHADGDGHAGHGSERIELGTIQISGLTVRAAREKGEIKPGGEAGIDLSLTGEGGKSADVPAIRLWIGTEDAKGSIKAKAESEGPEAPDHWHSHIEVPDPLPAGGKLWIELELPGGAKAAAGLDLMV